MKSIWSFRFPAFWNIVWKYPIFLYRRHPDERKKAIIPLCPDDVSNTVGICRALQVQEEKHYRILYALLWEGDGLHMLGPWNRSDDWGKQDTTNTLQPILTLWRNHSELISDFFGTVHVRGSSNW